MESIQDGGLSIPGFSSLPKIPGASSLPKLPGASKTPGATPKPEAKTGLSKYIPFNVEWFGLFILAGGIPIPPFSYLGYGGLNLWAAGSLMYFAMKAATQAILVLINTFVTVYYPGLWWVGYLLFLNPWYLFDILQMFSPAFAKEGFKVPFTHFNPKKPLGKQVDISGNKTFAGGTVTAALLAASLALLGAGTYGLLNLLPPSITSGYKPIINSIFAVLGGVTALGGGSAGIMMLPQLMGSLKTNSAEFTAATAQKGGSAELPSLDEVANRILEHKPLQSGGGESEDLSSNIFIGILTLVTLGGISLALVRSKAESRESV